MSRKLQLMIGFHNIRRSPAVDAQPSVELEIWRAFRVSSSSVHLVGILPGTFTVRITTEIACVRAWAREVQTGSGRRYTLQSAPTLDEGWRSVIKARALCLGADLVDESDDVWQRLLRGAV